MDVINHQDLENCLALLAVEEYSLLVATGSTASGAEVTWAVGVCLDLMERCEQTDSSSDEESDVELPVSKDAGAFREGWYIIYQGDSECHKVDGDGNNWRSFGVMTTDYRTWGWQGSVSSGASTEITTGLLTLITSVEAYSSNRPQCTAQRQLVMETTRDVHLIDANFKFGPTTSSGEGSLSLLALGECDLVVDPGILTVGLASMGAFASGSILSGHLAMGGTGEIGGEEFLFTADGIISPLCAPPDDED